MKLLCQPLRYLIGADSVEGQENFITEVPFDQNNKPTIGTSIGYCNLLDERNQYDSSIKEGTSEDYTEGWIDPTNPDFDKNLIDQFTRRKQSGFLYIELDNPDSYSLSANLRAINLAKEFDLQIIAKNPLLGCTDDKADKILSHPNVVGVVVERDAGTPQYMEVARLRVGKPDMPTWFVFYRNKPDINIRDYHNIWASYSPRGEYATSIQLT